MRQIVSFHRKLIVFCLGEVIGLCSVLRPFQHSIGYGRRFLQVKRPNQQYQSTEGKFTNQTTETTQNRHA